MSDQPLIGKVSLVILTYKRTSDLRELLPLLHEQIAREHHEDFDILVIDNDPEASARSVVEADTSPMVRYVHEPAPGIAHARNRALDETRGSELLIFIDDDERPLDSWLGAMLSAYRKSRPAGVTGPLYPRYEIDPDPWIVAGGFFVRKEYPEGHLMPAAGTGNLLLDLEQVRSYGIRFSERFGLSGGSDNLFTRTLIRRGGRIVWASDAALVDRVPAQRLTRQWVLNRQYRFGNTWSRASLELVDAGPRRLASRVSLTAKGLARVGYGVLRGSYGVASRSVEHRARAMRAIRRGQGMIGGAWGSVYQEYRRSPAGHP